MCVCVGGGGGEGRWGVERGREGGRREVGVWEVCIESYLDGYQKGISMQV